MSAEFEQPAWDERYAAAPSVWSGRPNPQLVTEAADLAAGTALDVGCGEGADALWLAERGWRVTAVDFSTVALGRAAARAAEQGLADRVEWVHADVRTWAPPEGRFALVTAQYMHLPTADRDPLFARLAAGVAPGGTLLVVGHLVGDDDPRAEHAVAAPGHEAHATEKFFTAEEVAAGLDPAGWEVQVAERRARPDNHAHGRPVADAVLRARRLR